MRHKYVFVVCDVGYQVCAGLGVFRAVVDVVLTQRHIPVGPITGQVNSSATLYSKFVYSLPLISAACTNHICPNLTNSRESLQVNITTTHIIQMLESLVLMLYAIVSALSLKTRHKSQETSYC